MKRDPEDWSEADLANYTAAPVGLTFESMQQLHALPAPSYVVDGRRFWQHQVIAEWVPHLAAAYYAANPEDFKATLAAIHSMPGYPNGTAH